MSAHVLIMAGGTGGHVYPALAVATVLRERGAQVSWLGTRSGLEARVVEAAGIPLHFVRVSGLRGKGLVRLLAAPLMLALSLMDAVGLLARLKPSVVLGMGGFAAGPGGLAAWLLRRPLLVHEQNSVPGLTNRLLARLARRVLEAFPHSFPAGRGAVRVGNPVRADIAAIEPPEQRFQGRDGALRLLVLGGSQGALALNRALPQALAKLPPAARPEVLHQCGSRHQEMTRTLYRDLQVEARVEPFLDDMARAYGWADLVVCRAGAMTIAELSATGVASLLVPFPHAVDDHQTHNARFLVAAGAARLLPQSGLDTGPLGEQLQSLLGDRAALTDMALKARQLAVSESAERVAGYCLEAASV